MPSAQFAAKNILDKLMCKNMYFAYILKSLADSRYYYGSTDNLDDRLKKHNSKRVKSTKSRVPFIVHYYEAFETRKDAVGRERFFKSINGYIWLKENNII